MADNVKSDNIELSKRIETIFDLICKGYSRIEIILYASRETDWNVSDRQVYTYIDRALTRYVEESKVVKEAELGKAMVRLGLLFSRSMDIQDYKTALAIQKEISETLGIKSPSKFDHTTKGEKINVLNLGSGKDPNAAT